MGFIWTIVPSSPALERRAEVREICKGHGGRLVEEQIFYGADGSHAYALIELPAGADQQALVDDLSAHEWLGLVHADEHAGGTQPPASGNRP